MTAPTTTAGQMIDDLCSKLDKQAALVFSLGARLDRYDEIVEPYRQDSETTEMTLDRMMRERTDRADDDGGAALMPVALYTERMDAANREIGRLNSELLQSVIFGQEASSRADALAAELDLLRVRVGDRLRDLYAEFGNDEAMTEAPRLRRELDAMAERASERDSRIRELESALLMLDGPRSPIEEAA